MQKHTHDTLEQIKHLCATLDDKKAMDVRVLDVAGKSTITDFFILASGTSEPHLKALGRALERACKDEGITVAGMDAETASGWLVLDGFDFMVHLFLPAQREYYQLEALWKDAEEVPLELPLTA